MATFTSGQMRAARGLLGISQGRLAELAEVSVETVKRLEGLPGEVSANRATLSALTRALDAAGVIFVDENGEGPGVRLRKAR